MGGLDHAQATARVRTILPDADVDDLVLLDDLLGIGHGQSSDGIDPDARRRRLSTLLDAALLARPDPALYIIDDAQWIDGVSESMLAEFIAAVPRTHALVLITHRPEYSGALSQAPDGMTVSLGPLDHSHTSVLVRELLGSDPSIDAIKVRIAERSAGNPFFTEEIVRDLAERGSPRGRSRRLRQSRRRRCLGARYRAGHHRGAHRPSRACRPKRTLNAASVIGSRFDEELLATVLGELALTELVAAELVEPGRRRVTPICISPSAHSRCRVRIAAEIEPFAAAPAGGGGHRKPRADPGREECRSDRHAPGSRRRPARRVRLAHEGWNMVDPSRHHCGTDELATRSRRR